MRILIVAGFFAPYAPTAGVRPGKLAKYLLSRGHDVRVIAAEHRHLPPLLPREIPEHFVTYARTADVNAPPRMAAAFINRLRGSGEHPAPEGKGNPIAPAPKQTAPTSGLRQKLRQLSTLYTTVTNWPDPQIGWLPFAVSAGRKLLANWQAEIIYASAPPHTGFLVAKALAQRFTIPWIAEYRDLWTDHPYYTAPTWRARIERRQEDRIIGSAAGLVTVSDVWRTVLQERYDKPTITVLNGFDPDDYPEDSIASSGDRLEVLYTGSLYPGRRDPTALFGAMARMGEAGRSVHVTFYGADVETVFAMARNAGVSDQVSVNPAISYRQVVELQRKADVLLLLRWSDPSERGVVPGKLFEYIGARRPILCIGRNDGTVPEIIGSRQLGLVSEDPVAIAEQLSKWIAMKRTEGVLAPLPLSARAGYSRADQFELAERFMMDLARKTI